MGEDSAWNGSFERSNLAPFQATIQNSERNLINLRNLFISFFSENEKYVHSESLVRQLSLLPSYPLVSFLHFGVHEFENPQNSSFLRSGEFLLDVVASYYGAMAVSFWKALFPLVTGQEKGEIEGFNYPKYFLDKTHPSALGHKLAGELYLAHLFGGFLSLLERKAQSIRENKRDGKNKAKFEALSNNHLCGSAKSTSKGQFSKFPNWGPQFERESRDLPEPLLEESRKETFCFLAPEIKATSSLIVGKSKGETEISDGWKLAPCGPLIPQIKCWISNEKNSTLTATFAKTKGKLKFAKLAFVYKIRHFKKWEGKGANVLINGNFSKFLPISVKGNTLTHWWLDPGVDLKEPLERVDFITNSEKFDVVALVGYSK